MDMKKLNHFLNPIARLGERTYSHVFPLAANLVLVIFSELFAYGIARNPMIIGTYIIFLNAAFIIYFAFRDGIFGGVISSLFAMLYYFYIIYTRHYHGALLESGIITTVILGLIYFFLGTIIGWLKQTIDKLIEREANEKQRLQTILQQLPVGVVITDDHGVVQQTNKQLEIILGQKMPKGLLAGKDMIVQAKQNNKAVNASQSPLAHVLTTGRPIGNKEFTIERPDKKQISINVSASVIRSKAGKIIAAASLINDITQQKEMEERKDDFVNMASHELKTPITSMKLYIDSLMFRIKQQQDEKSVKILGNIKTQTERLQELVNDLLDVSRLQTGKLTFSKEQFRIDELLKESIEGIEGGTRKQKIIFHHPSSITVSADRFRIYQVITNLITNAIKYSPEEKEIHVKVKRAHDKVVVSVQDFGIGIAKDEQKKIFERLYQVSGDKEKTFPGFGMGLYISREIIRRHRGHIWVESEKGKGSTFYFTLPTVSK
jgi:PAS domain S-box-containing protein